MAVAALLRVAFAVGATKLLALPGLLFLGSLLLCWVCGRLYGEIRENIDRSATDALVAAGDAGAGYTGPPQRTLAQALWTITLADFSMSLDNVLAVAAIADGDTVLLIFGLGLAILLIAFAARLIMKLLTRHPWILWLGLIVLIYVAGQMMFRGVFDSEHGIGPMLGRVEGMELGKGH